MTLDLHTFSIAARDPRTGDFGVAVATARPGVGALVPWVSRRGAIATQARVDTDFGRLGLARLDAGASIGAALRALLDADADQEIRQVHGVDTQGVFTHTGRRCVDWCGHLEGPDFTVAGNMLAGADVIAAMAAAYRGSPGLALAERLLVALEAGQAAGGDRRGKRSAAVLVASDAPRLYHNLRVDDHVEPVAELRRIHDRVVAHVREIETEYGAEGASLFGRVKY